MEKNTHSLHGKSVRFSSFPSSDGWSFQIIQQDMGVQADHSHAVRVQLQFLLMLRPQRPLPVFILCAFPFLTDAVDCRGAALVPVFKVQGYPGPASGRLRIQRQAKMACHAFQEFPVRLLVLDPRSTKGPAVQIRRIENPGSCPGRHLTKQRSV